MKGLDWKSNDLLRGNRSHEGDIVILCDPDTLGHVLNMVMSKGTTTGTAPAGFTHPFTVGAPKSYTMEIKKGLYAQRFYGVFIDKVTLEFADGQMQATLSVKAMGQFSVGSVAVALTGVGMTTLVMDDEYDINPTRGLAVGDILNINGTEATILTVAANGTSVTFASATITAGIGTPVFLKPMTVTQPTLYDPFYFGNLFAGVGIDVASSVTASASRAVATPIYDLKIVINNNLFSQNGSNRMDPVQIFTTTKEAQIELSQIFQNVLQRQSWSDRTKQAMTFVFWGKFLDAAYTIQEKCVMTFNRVKLIEDPNDLKVGELIMDTEKFEVLWDNTDGAAMAISLVNRSAGTVY